MGVKGQPNAYALALKTPKWQLMCPHTRRPSELGTARELCGDSGAGRIDPLVLMDA
jgi:hypothetical protein